MRFILHPEDLGECNIALKAPFLLSFGGTQGLSLMTLVSLAAMAASSPPVWSEALTWFRFLCS